MMDFFNNREWALVIWGIVFFLLVLWYKGTRKDVLGVLKDLSDPVILKLITATLLYTGTVIILLYIIGFWDFRLAKDTVIWFLGTGLVFVFTLPAESQKEHYFLRILLEGLKLTLILEFVLNLYTFQLWLELLLIPVILFLVILGSIAATNKVWISVKRISDFLLNTYFISVLVFTLHNIYRDYRSLILMENVREVVLLPLLTAAFIPFLYLLALVMAYENFDLRLKAFLKKDDILVKYTRRAVFGVCLLNLNRLNKFAKGSTLDLMKVENKDDVRKMIIRFKNGELLLDNLDDGA